MIAKLLDVAWTPETANLCLQGAREAQRAGLMEEYLLCCQRIVSLRPEWHEGWEAFSSALFFTGRMRGSIAASMKVAEIKRNEVAKTELAQLQIRFLGDIWTGPIGHLTFLDSLAKSEILGWSPPEQRVLLSTTATSNPCYLNYWRKYFPLISDPEALARIQPVAEKLKMDFEVWPFKDGRLMHAYEAIDSIQQQWEAENRPPLLAISEAEVARGRDELSRLGMPRDAWFIALHIRQRPSDPTSTRRTARNADVSTYEQMVKSVVARGGWVVCMGNGSAVRPAPHVIDYGPNRTDWMDVFLWATCRFFVGTTSGPIHVSSTFGVPTVQTNSLLGFRTWPSRDLFIPKRHWLSAERRYLTIEEELSGPAAWSEWPEFLGRQGIELRDNTPEEIDEVVSEMMDRLDGTVAYTAQENQMQDRFRRLPADRGCMMFGNSRMGRAFLQRHSDLLSLGHGRAVPSKPTERG